MTDLRPILLAEDNLKDVELVLVALKRNNLANQVVVARDGAEALDYLYRRGNFLGREGGGPGARLLGLGRPQTGGRGGRGTIKGGGGSEALQAWIRDCCRDASGR